MAGSVSAFVCVLVCAREVCVSPWELPARIQGNSNSHCSIPVLPVTNRSVIVGLWTKPLAHLFYFGVDLVALP